MTRHNITDDVVYNLVSIQYHALQAVESYESYLQDARADGDKDVLDFVTECKQQDLARARRCHELLKPLTADV